MTMPDDERKRKQRKKVPQPSEDKMTATRAQKDGGCQSAALRDCHHKPASPCHTAARREDGVCKSGCRRARPRFGRTETPGRRTTPMQRHGVLPRSPPIPRGSRPKIKSSRRPAGSGKKKHRRIPSIHQLHCRQGTKAARSTAACLTGRTVLAKLSKTKHRRCLLSKFLEVAMPS